MNVGLFLLWSIALFAPISMQMFGGDFGFMNYDDQELRFDTFLQAFLSLFDVSQVVQDIAKSMLTMANNVRPPIVVYD